MIIEIMLYGVDHIILFFFFELLYSAGENASHNIYFNELSQ